jgi:hypothetical protein
MHHFVLALVAAAAVGVSVSSAGVVTVGGQADLRFRARLSFVPLDLAMQNTIAGTGAATATLSGTRLTISGTFKDLKTPATVARVHAGRGKGIRGPAVFDLEVTQATSGTLQGAYELSSAQLQDLKKGHWYIQLHSQKAPEGNLWGWLLPQEERR